MKSLREKIKRSLFKIQRHIAFEEELLPHVKLRYYGGVTYLTWDVESHILGYVTTRARIKEFTYNGIVTVLKDTFQSLKQEMELVKKFGYSVKGYGLYWKKLEETQDLPLRIRGVRMMIHHSSIESNEENHTIEIEGVIVDSESSYGVLKETEHEAEPLLKTRYTNLLETLVSFERDRLDLEYIASLPPEGRDLILKSPSMV